MKNLTMTLHVTFQTQHGQSFLLVFSIFCIYFSLQWNLYQSESRKQYHQRNNNNNKISTSPQKRQFRPFHHYTCISREYSLPEELFEFVVATVALLSHSIVRNHPIGNWKCSCQRFFCQKRWYQVGSRNFSTLISIHLFVGKVVRQR